jgi:hypothetical protein
MKIYSANNKHEDVLVGKEMGAGFAVKHYLRLFALDLLDCKT